MAMELWRRPFLVTGNEVRTIVPVDWNGFSAFEVSIYPQSRLVLINRSMLFRCARPAFPSFEKKAWCDLIGATTHVGLRRTHEYWIFLTKSTSDSFSFTHTDDQPFGIWTELLPVRIPLELQRFGRSLYDQKWSKILAWATASHHRLGSKTRKWFRELLSNTDLMQLIVGGCFK